MARRRPTDLYPIIEPYRTGFLNVGDCHRMYYEECGNLNGFPIVYVHGGLGAGCNEGARRFFDPRKWRIVLFDQRGSGRSRPYASTESNTTPDLVQDIRRLLAHCKIRRAVFFGGSWGSTLSLLFSIAYPKCVAGMVLRGIWLADEEALQDYCKGIPNTRFPEVWERFIGNVPWLRRCNPVEYYYEKMTAGDLSERRHFAYEMWRYEESRAHLTPPTALELEQNWKGSAYESIAILEAHYIRNRCFLDEGRNILEHTNRIPNVPIVMVHGRYDDLCPVDGAIALSRVLPQAKLHIMVAGHSRRDPEIQKKLVSETDALFNRIKK